MSAANKDLVARLHTDVLDTGDLAPIDELVHPDYRNHEAAPGTPGGRDGFRHTVAFLRGGFPDLRFVIEDMVAEHDRVVVRCRFEGTHAGAFLGIPPTGRRVSTSTSTSTGSRTTWSPSTGPAATTSAASASSARSRTRPDAARQSRSAESTARATCSRERALTARLRASAQRSALTSRASRPRSARTAAWSTCPAICSARRSAAACWTRTQPRVAVLGRDAQQILADGRDRAGRTSPRRVGRGVHDDLPDDAPARMAGLAPGDEEAGQGVRDDGAVGLGTVGVECRKASAMPRPAPTARATWTAVRRGPRRDSMISITPG